MQERHDILARTIGYRDEEQEALDNGYWYFYTAFLIVFFGTLLQIPFFWLYNGLCHPFANILKDYSDEDKCKMMNHETILLQALKISLLDTEWNDLKTLPTKIKNIVDGSLFLSDDPNTTNLEGKPLILSNEIEFHIKH